MNKIKINSAVLSDLKLMELRQQLLTLEKELLNLRFQKVSGSIVNISVFSKVKKDIARVQTELTKRNTYGDCSNA